MAGKTKRDALLLTEDQKTMLRELSRSRTASAREIECAKVLIGYAEGISIAELQRKTGGSRPTIEYVHTPKHGSWLNLIECAFSKMARTFLRHIRVSSIDELKTRIMKGIDEINASPVVFRWNKFDLGMA